MKYYYATMKRGSRTGWLAGPFAGDHALALAQVDLARAEACKVDPRAHFDAFGTSSIERADDLPPPKAGVLNGRLGLAL